MEKIQNFGLINENFYQEIPDYYSKRYISNDKNYRVEIFPSKDVSFKRNLDEFVYDVESIFPNATGMPIIQQKAGLIVIESFITALTISIIFLITRYDSLGAEGPIKYDSSAIFTKSEYLSEIA